MLPMTSLLALAVQGYPAADLSVGSVAGDDVRLVDFTAAHLQVFDKWTPAVGGSTTSVIYARPGEAAVTYTIAAVTTAAGLAAALSDGTTALGAAVLQDYTVDATTAVCLARNPGLAGAFTNAGSITWTHTDTGSNGTDIPVGRLILRQAASSYPAGGILGRLPTASTTYKPTSQQVVAITGASLTTGDIIETRVWMEGVSVPAVATTLYNGTSNDSTVAAHAAALDTLLNTRFGAGSGVVASAASGVMTLTADVKGARFTVEAGVTAGGTGTFLVTSTTGAPESPTTDIVPNILGIVTHERAVQDSSGVLVVESRTAGVAMRRGRIRVEVADAGNTVAGARVFVDPTTGKFYAAIASGLLRLPDNYRWYEDATAPTVAWLEVL